jgi:zinc protease
MNASAVFATIAFALLCQAGAAPAVAQPPVHLTTLDNGLELLVIEDKRAPIVTHMIWYRVGRADEPPGRSGLAHFVEHLMFKATAAHETGEFQRAVGQLGGSDNALTSQDSTVYYQRMAKQHLSTAMRFEADRMQNLRPTEQDMVVERDIVLAERRQRIDQSPLDILNEEMAAAHFRNHPYGSPVLGWPQEISALTLADAMAF